MTARLSAIPGLRLTLGVTLLWLSVVVLVPLSAVALRPFHGGGDAMWATLADARVLSALRLSFGSALLAAALDVPLGLLLVYAIVRLRFPGRRLLDAVIDLPFALPTAVAGIALAALTAPNGWIGAPVQEVLGLKIAYTRAGIVYALMFTGLPFIVRTIEPVLRDFQREAEEAAATLGATRGQTLRRVVLPALAPALIAGFGLAFARAVGEYGSVIFIAGNVPRATEIAPLLIVIRLEEYDDAGAAAVGLAMLVLSFAVLLATSLLQRRLRASVA